MLIRFVVDPTPYGRWHGTKHTGVVFHRWLPDGEQDAIEISTDDFDSRVRVWFERRGRLEGSYIRYDPKSKDTRPDIIERQAVLEAVHLFGTLEIQAIPPEQFGAVRENRTGDPNYLALGKRVVKKTLHPAVARFMKILRTNCGQYWLGIPEPWDSRKESLGRFCDLWSMKWSLDGNNWSAFLPDEPKVEPLVVRVAPARMYLEFLTKDDWERLREIAASNYEPSLALETLSRAHEATDQNELRQGLIEAVTALELAIGQLVRWSSVRSEILENNLGRFWQAGIQQQFAIVAAASRRIDALDVDLCFEVIRERNKVTHESWQPTEETKGKLRRFLKIVGALCEELAKFPIGYPGNALISPEGWDEAYKRGEL